MTKYYLHTGLHKTGTKFFQHKVFPNLPKTEFEYNPTQLTQLVCDLMKADKKDLPSVLKAIGAEKSKLEALGDKKILISREIMSGNLFSAYVDSDETISRLKAAFPQAHILCSFRFQPDWLVSCYRESVHEHHYQSFAEFAGIEEQSEHKFVALSYKDLDYERIIQNILSCFGDNTSFFFYEDLKANKPEAVKTMAKALGLKNIRVTNDDGAIPNRGYSAFSINLSISRYRILTALGLENRMVHRPIYFFGEKSIPAGFKDLSVLPDRKYWEGFLADNEEVRSNNYPKLTLKEQVKKEFTWRNFIKNRLDKYVYRDDDLLGESREEIETFFRARNKVIFERYKAHFSIIPSLYLD